MNRAAYQGLAGNFFTDLYEGLKAAPAAIKNIDSAGAAVEKWMPWVVGLLALTAALVGVGVVTRRKR